MACRLELKSELEKMNRYFGRAIKSQHVHCKTVSVSTTRKKFVNETDSSRDTVSISEMSEDDAFGFTAKEIASQLTLHQAEILGKLQMGEFLDKNFEDPEKSPNINNISILCNKTSSWVASYILDGKDIKDMINRYLKFIKIANELHKLKNYNSCTAVIGGLTCAPISRLKKLQSIPDKDKMKLEKLKEIYSPLNSYSNYRNLIKGSKCIPLIGVYLRELTLCSDGNAIYLDEAKEIINFERMKLVGSRILELDSIDASPYFYELQPIKGLNTFLMNLIVRGSDELYEKSLKIQPLKPTKTPEQLEQENTTLRESLSKQTALLEKTQNDIESHLIQIQKFFAEYQDKLNSMAGEEQFNVIQEHMKDAIALCNSEESSEDSYCDSE